MHVQPSLPILLVEDDPDDAFFMTRAFASECPAAELHIVRDGEEAIAYLAGRGRYADRAAHPFPCHVLLDLKLPRLSGLEVLRWIRAQPAHAALPVTVLSGSDLPSDVAEARTLGVADYLQKAVSLPGFIEAVRRFCVSAGCR